MKNQKQAAAIVCKNVAGILIGIILLASCAEEEFSPTMTREFSIQSNANGAIYPVRVGLPVGYDPSAGKYSVIYVLDGDENFDFVANNSNEISRDHSTQNVVVVGIGYGRDRSIDYTPTKTDATGGGSSEFLDFIEFQLIPRIEEDFRVDTARSGRTILGHSFGGLLGANAFAVRNHLFGNYILLSPSIWVDNEVSLALERQNRDANRDKHQLVFLGLGQMENSGRMQAPFEALFQILRDNYNNITLTKHVEPHLSHVGSKNPNIVRGLNFYFKNR